jgi:hypothetical protein
MLLQLFSIPLINFADSTTTFYDETELLEQYKKYETALISATEPGFEFTFNAAFLTLDSGKKALHWYFKSPSSLDENQQPRTVQEEHYVSIVCGKNILSLYSAMTNSDDPQKVREMLVRIANAVKVYDDRIDLNQLALDIIEK